MTKMFIEFWAGSRCPNRQKPKTHQGHGQTSRAGTKIRPMSAQTHPKPGYQPLRPNEPQTNPRPALSKISGSLKTRAREKTALEHKNTHSTSKSPPTPRMVGHSQAGYMSKSRCSVGPAWDQTRRVISVIQPLDRCNWMFLAMDSHVDCWMKCCFLLLRIKHVVVCVFFFVTTHHHSMLIPSMGTL